MSEADEKRPVEPVEPPVPAAEPLERGESTGGAMTGETGVLSSEDEPEGFVPGERREIEHPRPPGQRKRRGPAS